MGSMLSQKGPIFASSLNPRRTHTKEICKTHVGPIMVAHMGPILSQKGPILPLYMNNVGPMPKSFANPSGRHNGSPYGANVVPERYHVGPISKAMWDPCQSHLQNLSGPHNGILLWGQCVVPERSHVGPISKSTLDPCQIICKTHLGLIIMYVVHMGPI